jgi:hypothetical protein
VDALWTWVRVTSDSLALYVPSLVAHSPPNDIGGVVVVAGVVNHFCFCVSMPNPDEQNQVIRAIRTYSSPIVPSFF